MIKLNANKIAINEIENLYRGYRDRGVTGNRYGYKWSADYKLIDKQDEKVYIKMDIVAVEVQPNSKSVNVQAEVNCKPLGIRRQVVEFIAEDRFKQGGVHMGRELAMGCIIRGMQDIEKALAHYQSEKRA